MKITCPTCKTTIPGDDIDVHSGTAVCKPCGEVFPFREAVASSTELVGVERALTIKPADLVVVQPVDPSDGAIVFAPKSRLAALPILAFAAVWNAFLVFWYTAAFSFRGGPAGIALWFPILHVGAGVFMLWMGLAALLSKMRVRFEGEMLVVTQRPIPTRRRVAVPWREIRHVVVAENFVGTGSKANQWQVVAELTSSEAVCLFTVETKQDAAYFVGLMEGVVRDHRALTAARETSGYR